MNLSIVAQSGWGKSHTAQEKAEMNLPRADFGVVLDRDDEYRGLVLGGFARWAVAGPDELSMTVEDWVRVIRRNKKIVLASYHLDGEQWRSVVAKVGMATRRLYEQIQQKVKLFLLIDEAHEVAPQDKGFPDPIAKIATMGRGEGVSTIWVTQRPAQVDKEVLGQCTAQYAGGFAEKNDLDAISISTYPVEVHDWRVERVPGLPGEICTSEGEPLSLRKFVDEQGEVVGSEWIYSDDTGELWRETRDGSRMTTTHYGNSGWRLAV